MVSPHRKDMHTISYHDSRAGDTYDAQFSEKWEFIKCLRHVDGKLGPDPIEYSSFEEIPNPAREEIHKKWKIQSL